MKSTFHRALRAATLVGVCVVGIARADTVTIVPTLGAGYTGRTVDEAGDTYLFEHAPGSVRLSRIAADGEIRYRTTSPTAALQYSDFLQFNDDRACFVTLQGTIPSFYNPRPSDTTLWAACFDREDGAKIYETQLPTHFAVESWRVAVDGRLVAITRPYGGDPETVTVVGPSGDIERRTTFVARHGRDAASRSTRLFAAERASPGAALAGYREFAADGTALTLFPTFGAARGYGAIVLADDNVAILTNNGDDDPTTLRIYAPDGTVTREFLLPISVASIKHVGARVGADVLVVATRAGEVVLTLSGTGVTTQPLPFWLASYDVEGRHGVRSLGAYGTLPLVEAVSLVDGTVTRRTYRDPELPEPPYYRVLPDGSVVSTTLGAGQLRVERIDGLAVASTPMPIVQPGLRGAWAGIGVAGQGLVFDVDEASGTIFAPWFTYSNRVGANAPASTTRWYTLQGSAAPDATSATLAIYANEGGNLANAPNTTARRVGSASVSFDGCDTLLLDFAFDPGENDAAAGLQVLKRLTSRNDDCRLADGTIIAADVPAPVGAFDAALSGTWFDPANGGQGFRLIVRPGEALFGAWFTFDPIGVTEDATRQHWFTLQGALPATTGASLAVPLYMTTGGAFGRDDPTSVLAVGFATLTPLACDRIRLEYRFTGNGAYAFIQRNGTIDLRRFGGCGD